MSANQISASRFKGFHIGNYNTYSTAEDGSIVATAHNIEPAKVTKNKLNYAATLQLTYNLTNQFGLTADATIATRFHASASMQEQVLPRNSTSELQSR